MADPGVQIKVGQRSDEREDERLTTPIKHYELNCFEDLLSAISLSYYYIL